jgi:hypothetical protein
MGCESLLFVGKFLSLPVKQIDETVEKPLQQRFRRSESRCRICRIVHLKGTT